MSITADHWIHTVTLLAELNGWYVNATPNARAHRETHICVKDGRILVLYARPEGKEILGGHKPSMKAWQQAQVNENVQVRVVHPGELDELLEVLEGGVA